MSVQFKNYSEYVSYNDRFPTFKNKSPKLKRADWQAYLLRQKKKAVQFQLKSDNANRTMVPAPPPRPRARNRLPRQVIGRPTPTRSPISECTLLYAQASIDPFSKLTKNPCIPDNLSAPSFKFTAKIECEMVAGDFVGFVALCPWVMSLNDPGNVSGAINSALVTTTSDYALNDVLITAGQLVPGGGLNAFNSNSPFSSAEYENTPMRLVAAGVEIIYTGQLLNQSGAITVLQNDGLNPWSPNTTISYIKQNPRAMTCANSKDNRCYVSYYPTDQKYLSYSPTSLKYSSNNGQDNNHPLIIAVSGATPNTTFMVKAVAHFEAQIPTLGATPSDSDPIGYPAFNAARSQLLPSNSPQVDLKNTLIATLKNVGRSVSGMGGMIGGAIGTAVGNPAAGTAIGSAAGELLSSILGD
jgi:uncharacterized membrane protein